MEGKLKAALSKAVGMMDPKKNKQQVYRFPLSVNLFCEKKKNILKVLLKRA